MSVSEANLESYQLQDTIYRLLQEQPEWRRYFEEMVAWHEQHPGGNTWDGWQWTDVHTSPSIINSLISRGVVDLTSSSRQYKHYKLRSMDDTRAALKATAQPERSGEPIDVDSLFTLVVGHETIKQLIRYAVKAESPVHCLLIGPPGTAKTLILSDIGRLPGAEFYVGSTTTKSGLVGLLLSSRPQYLVIDELDKMEDKDMSPLLNLMETGMVARLIHGSHERITLATKVFAGANDMRKISQPILSRFAKCDIPPYSPKEFVDVARQVLMAREGMGQELAMHTACEVVKYSTDIRDVVRVARMAGNNPFAVLEVVQCLWGKGMKRGLHPV